MNSLKNILVAAITALAFVVSGASAEPLAQKPQISKNLFHPERIVPVPKAPEGKPFAEHFFAYQASAGEPFKMRLVLNNTANTINHYGPDSAVVEVVAYGPGLRLLFEESKFRKRITRLADRGVQFTACANTMQAMGRSKDSLHPDVEVVTGGVVRLNELQEAGWTYIRP